MHDNTDDLLLWEPDDAFSPLEIWCGCPTGSEVIGWGSVGYWIAPLAGAFRNFSR